MKSFFTILAMVFVQIFLGPVVCAETRLIASNPLVWKDFLGVNAHFLWFTPAEYEKQITKYKQLGLEWVRVDLHWAIHEPERDKFVLKPIDDLTDSLRKNEIKSVFYLVGSAPFASSAPGSASNKDQYPPTDFSLFAQRMGMFAQRYPIVSAWQVWNEPNIPTFWQPRENAQAYGQLLRESVAVLRGAVPDKPIVAGGMAYYSQQPIAGGFMFEELGKLGVLNLKAIAAYHPYSKEPEGDVSKSRDFITRSQEVNRRLRDVKVPAIWATEWGWSSYDGPKEEQPIIGQDGQADYLLRRLALMSALDFDRIFLFALSDLDTRATVRDQRYGLLALDGSPKPAYTALSRFLSITGPTLVPDGGPELISETGEQFSVAWRRPDGSRLWMFWAGTPGVVELSGLTQATLHQPLVGTKQDVDVVHGRAKVSATRQLQILEWK